MDGFFETSDNLECRLKSASSVTSGEDIDRSAGADEPFSDSVDGIPEQDRLTDNGFNFAYVGKGVPNVGS
jgi:hypothetical protein